MGNFLFSFFTEETLSPARTATPDILLLERRSPIGAESEEEEIVSKVDAKLEMTDMNDDTWEGWDEQDGMVSERDNDALKSQCHEDQNESEGIATCDINALREKEHVVREKPLDLNCLDIKVSGEKHSATKEDNFFADMEPAIPSSLCLLDILEGKDIESTPIQSTEPVMPQEIVGSKFAVADNEADATSDGWGEDDWGEDF